MRRIAVHTSRIVRETEKRGIRPMLAVVLLCTPILQAGWADSADAQITKEMIAAKNAPNMNSAIIGTNTKKDAAKENTEKPGTSIWQRDIEATVAQAERDGRLILMHFWAPDCDDCRKMERDFFGNPQIAEALSEYYLCIPINGPQRPDVLRQLGRQEIFPTDLVLRPNGTTLFGGRSGVVPPKEYLVELIELGRHHRKMLTEAEKSDANAKNSPEISIEADRFAVSEHAVFEHPADHSENDFAEPTTPGSDSLTVPPFPMPQEDPFPIGKPELPKVLPTPELAPVFADRFGNSLTTDGEGMLAWTTPSVAPATTMPTTDETLWVTEKTSTATEPDPMTEPTVMETLTIEKTAVMAEPMVATEILQELPIQDSLTPEDAGIAPAEMNDRLFPDGGHPHIIDSHQATSELTRFTESERKLLHRAPPLALEGYSAVMLATQGRWVHGNTRYGVIHRGQTYLFTSEQEVRIFLMDPEHYAPALSGYDAVEAIESGRLVPGRREIAARMDGGHDRYQVWFFASEESYERFDASPEKYIRAAEEIIRQNDQRAAREARMLGESMFR